MERFYFLKDEFPELFNICQEANSYIDSDPSIALTKARQALEKIVGNVLTDNKIYVNQDLFTNISSISGIDGDICNEMHQLRMVGNNAVHGNEATEQIANDGIDLLLDITVWYYVEAKGKMLSGEELWTSDRDRVEKYLQKKQTSNTKLQKPTFGELVNPLSVDDFDSHIHIKNKNILEKDVFETNDEYENRIKNLPPIHIGYAVLNSKNIDSITGTAFLLFYIDKNRYIKIPFISAFYCKISMDMQLNGEIDGELVCKVFVYSNQICCDFNNLFFKNGHDNLSPVNVICWNQYMNESIDDYRARLLNLPLLPIGRGIPVVEKYDINTETLPIEVNIMRYAKLAWNEKVHLIDIHIDRDEAKALCEKNERLTLYGRIKQGNKFSGGSIYSKVLSENFCWTLSSESKVVPVKENLVKKTAVPQYNSDKQSGYKIRNEKSKQEEINIYIKAAKRGNANAQTMLGNCYFGGYGVEKNYGEAVKWFTKAAEQGNGVAQYRLGDCYFNGYGVEKNYEEAVKWFIKAAEQGDVYAQTRLGSCYREGWGVEKNYEKAVKWFTKAALEENTDAQYNLGLCYLNCRVDNCYLNGYGVEKNYEEAVKWLLKAANRGNAAAQYNLSLCYLNGLGIVKDEGESIAWLRRAAEYGNADAQYCFARRYLNGYGVRQDKMEAVKWLIKAVEQGNAAAQYRLGDCYKHGIGIDMDIERGIELQDEAIRQGYDPEKELVIEEKKVAQKETVIEKREVAEKEAVEKVTPAATSGCLIYIIGLITVIILAIALT